MRISSGWLVGASALRIVCRVKRGALTQCGTVGASYVFIRPRLLATSNNWEGGEQFPSCSSPTHSTNLVLGLAGKLGWDHSSWDDLPKVQVLGSFTALILSCNWQQD